MSVPLIKKIKTYFQTMPFFLNIDWHRLLEQEAPFVPQPDDELDTGYFEARNLQQNWNISQIIDP